MESYNSSPWLETIRDKCFIAKRERRQAERKWRNTKLTIFKDLSRQAMHKVSKLVHIAKCQFYTEGIALASSNKELCKIDRNDLNNYRPASNLSCIDKILESLVLSRVISYLNTHNHYNACQSAYRPDQNTETAIPKVVGKGNLSVLALLDLSSAFDTIDHSILVHRLHTDFGFTDIVLQ